MRFPPKGIKYQNSLHDICNRFDSLHQQETHKQSDWHVHAKGTNTMVQLCVASNTAPTPHVLIIDPIVDPVPAMPYTEATARGGK